MSLFTYKITGLSSLKTAVVCEQQEKNYTFLISQKLQPESSEATLCKGSAWDLIKVISYLISFMRSWRAQCSLTSTCTLDYEILCALLPPQPDLLYMPGHCIYCVCQQRSISLSPWVHCTLLAAGYNQLTGDGEVLLHGHLQWSALISIYYQCRNTEGLCRV